MHCRNTLSLLDRVFVEQEIHGEGGGNIVCRQALPIVRGPRHVDRVPHVGPQRVVLVLLRILGRFGHEKEGMLEVFEFKRSVDAVPVPVLSSDQLPRRQLRVDDGCTFFGG